MRYLLTLLAGLVVGAALFAVLLYLNPLARPVSVSPLAVSQSSMLELGFSAVPADTIATIYSNDFRGNSYPARVQGLWEPALSHTKVVVAQLRNSRGQPRAFGVKFSSLAKQAGLLMASVPADSSWHLWMLREGGLFVDQSENLWFQLHDVIVPAYLNTDKSWRGTWFGISTTGPGALGTARVTGGSGKYEGVTGEAVESALIKAYQAEEGPLSMDVNLTVSLPAER